MTTAIEGTPTNEQIATMLGCPLVLTGPSIHYYPKCDCPKHLRGHGRTKADRRIPKYLSDPSTLGEAERICRENELTLTIGLLRRGIAMVSVFKAGARVADSEHEVTMTAVWTVIWRAEQASKGASDGE